MKSRLAMLLLVLSATVSAQDAEPAAAAPAPAAAAAPGKERAADLLAHERVLKADTQVSKTAQVTIKGKSVPYKVTAGTQPVWDKDGKVIASLFYTYYQRTDVADKSRRPLVLSFNGGPGSASVWMHIAYTGPKLLNLDAEGYPTQPYGVHDNPHSILDVADIVYIDPVNTGFSRVLDGKNDRARFFGVNADIAYLAEWVSAFVSREGRWTSPKYLIGESYGTSRVAGLALELQNAQWMYLNGVVLVSPTELGLKREGAVGEALALPYFAATAWYQKVLPADLQSRDLKDVLPEVEAFTVDELLPALAKGGYLDPQKKAQIAAKMARYSGLSETSCCSTTCRCRQSISGRSCCAHRARPSAASTRATWASTRAIPATRPTTTPSSVRGCIRSRRPSTSTCATSSSSRPTSSTRCSATSIHGISRTKKRATICAWRWPPIPT